MVRPHQTSLNHCVQVGSMPTGKVQVSSGWFHLTEPPQTSSNHCVQVGSMPTGKVQVSSGWFYFLEPLCSSGKHAYREGSSEFGVVRPNRTSLNHCVQVGSMPTAKVQVSSKWFDLLEPLCSSGKHAYSEGSSEFGVVRPHRTSLNHCVQVGNMPTGKVQVSTGIEPLQTSLCSSGKHAYREGSSEFGVVRPHRTSLNHCVQVGSMPTGKVQVSSGWFNLTKPPRTTVYKGEACLQGRFK